MSGGGNSSKQTNGAGLEEELYEFCRSDSLSEVGLRGIFERHGFAPNNDPGIKSYKFFHKACINERVTEGILRYLIKYFPNAARFADANGQTPLHRVCENKNVTRGMVQLLIDAFPDSLRHENNGGRMPLHVLCVNKNLNEAVRLDVLKLLLEKCPETVRHTTISGNLPIHAAALRRSPEFCRLLIEAYPGSERMADHYGMLSFHRACAWNTVATAKCLYELYPESIHAADNDGRYPIHHAFKGIKGRKGNPATAVETVQFLLDCNPNVVSQKLRDKLPLYWVCKKATNENTRNLNAYLKVLQTLYDAYPEAIEKDEVTSGIDGFCEEVQTFINTQLTYARQVRGRTVRQMKARDENGQVPLHRALRDNVTLGSIKLLVKRNPSTIKCADNSGALPLHVTCQHHESASVVEYLLDLDPTALHAIDFDGNTALHYACRGTNHAIIALLLDKYGSISVSKRNAHNQLPIDLLLQIKNEVSDEESVKFTESIYRLIRANPEALMHYDLVQAGLEDCLSQQVNNNKKRKIDEV